MLFNQLNMKLTILLPVLLIGFCFACASNKESGENDSEGSTIQEQPVAPAPGTAVAEIVITNAIKSDENDGWIVSFTISKIIGYGSATKPLPEKIGSLKLSKSVLEKSGKKEIRKNEKLIFVLAGRQSMDQSTESQSGWSIIEIREI